MTAVVAAVLLLLFFVFVAAAVALALNITNVVQLVIVCLDDVMKAVVMHVNSDWYKIVKHYLKKVCVC